MHALWFVCMVLGWLELANARVDLYHEGSVCRYCRYCKFCPLCEADCPCTTSRSKPNCHMCKYCVYCSACSAICDTVCHAGGYLDVASSFLLHHLPKLFTTKEIEEDLKLVD